MPAPALKIPVEVNLDQFKQQMDRASSHVGSTLRLVSSQFAKLNGEVAAGGAAGAAAFSAGWLGSAAKIVTAVGAARLAIGGAALAMGAAIREAIQQLEEMVDIADKASRVGVSAEFFQGFVSEARKAKVEVETLEAALKNAFNVLKPTADLDRPFNDIDNGLTGVARKITEVETLLQQFHFELFDKERESPVFLREFEAAGASLQGQMRAVLTAMIELEAAGQKLAALALGEKVFGTDLINRIREGKTSAEEIRRSLDRPPANIFTQEQVDRAKEIDVQLKVAHETLTRNLRPAWEGLADASLTIKSIWADIVGLVAKAASAASVFSSDSARRQKQGELDEVNRRLATGEGTGLGALLGSGLSPAARGQLERRQQTLLRELGTFNQGFEPTFGPDAPANVPLPRRRPDGAPAPSSAGGPSRDRFDASAEAIERRTAALEAENANINLGTEARERARVAAELETVAKQINTQAGINNGQATAEQLAVIDRVAAAYGRAALAIEQARSPLATFARESANVGKQLNQFAATALDGLTNALTDVITGTKSAAEAFKALANSIINDLVRIAIRAAITGPIASALFGGIGGGATSLLPRFANGTNYAPGGWSWVGERGPELVNLPRGSQVIPNDVSRAMVGGGAAAYNIVSNVDARGSTMTEGQFKAVLAANNRVLLKQVEHIVPARMRQFQALGV